MEELLVRPDPGVDLRHEDAGFRDAMEAGVGEEVLRRVDALERKGSRQRESRIARAGVIDALAGLEGDGPACFINCFRFFPTQDRLFEGDDLARHRLHEGEAAHRVAGALPGVGVR